MTTFTPTFLHYPKLFGATAPSVLLETRLEAQCAVVAVVCTELNITHAGFDLSAKLSKRFKLEMLGRLTLTDTLYKAFGLRNSHFNTGTNTSVRDIINQTLKHLNVAPLPDSSPPDFVLERALFKEARNWASSQVADTTSSLFEEPVVTVQETPSAQPEVFEGTLSVSLADISTRLTASEIETLTTLLKKAWGKEGL